MALFDLDCQLRGPIAGALAAALFVIDLDIARWHVYVLTDSPYISLVILTVALFSSADF